MTQTYCKEVTVYTGDSTGSLEAVAWGDWIRPATFTTEPGQVFQIAVIPHTLKVTTLARLRPGSEVNMEADLVARYVEGLSRAAAR